MGAPVEPMDHIPDCTTNGLSALSWLFLVPGTEEGLIWPFMQRPVDSRPEFWFDLANMNMRGCEPKN